MALPPRLFINNISRLVSNNNNANNNNNINTTTPARTQQTTNTPTRNETSLTNTIPTTNQNNNNTTISTTPQQATHVSTPTVHKHLPPQPIGSVPVEISELVSQLVGKFLPHDDFEDDDFLSSIEKQTNALNMISSIVEYYEDKYQDLTDHPLLDLRRDFGIGSLLQITGEEFVEEIIQYLMHYISGEYNSEEEQVKNNFLLSILRTLHIIYPAGFEKTFLMDEIMTFFSKEVKEFINTSNRPTSDNEVLFNYSKYVYCLGLLGSISRNSSDATTFYIQDEIPQILCNRFKQKLENIPKRQKKKLNVTNFNTDCTTFCGEFPTITELEYQELRNLVSCLSFLGEYIEVILFIMQAGGASLILPLLKSKDKYLMSDGLKMSDSLLAHICFAQNFVEKGCLGALLKLPTINYLSGGLSLCLSSIASYPDIMDKVFKNETITDKLTEMGIGFLQSTHTELRKYGCQFFQNAFAYVSVVTKFDKESGLNILLSILKVVLNENSKEDQTLTRQLITTCCQTIRSYFQFHVLHFGFNLQKKISKKKKLKYMDFQNKEFTNRMALEPFKKNISALMNAFQEQIFSPVVKIVNSQDIMISLMEILNKSSYIWMDGIISFTVLEIFELISLSPFSHIPLVECEVPSGRTGISLLLGCSTVEREPFVVEAALRTIQNMFFPHSKPMSYLIPIRKNLCEVFRNNDGIRVLLDNLYNYDDPSNVNILRKLCCDILIELTNDSAINQILIKIEIGGLLTDLLKQKQNEEQHESFNQLKESALKLLEKVTGRKSKTVIREAKDDTLVRLEKATIASNTHITYRQDELLQLIHEYLDNKGLTESAKCLMKEAKITPLNFQIPSIPKPKPLLDRIVVNYLRQQHRECEEPIAVLPEFSLFHKHSCPKQGNSLKSSKCLVRRLNSRKFSMHPRDIGFDFQRKNRKFLYSRLKYSNTVIGESEIISSIAFTPDSSKIFCSSDEGELFIYDRNGGDLIDQVKIFEDAPLRGIQFSTDRLIEPRFLAWGESSTFLYGINSFRQPLFEYKDCFSATFSNGNDLVAASSFDTTKIYNIAHGEIIATLNDLSSENETIACFSPYDDLVLANACLWDIRIPRSVHRFDRLSQIRFNHFNSNGLEVIINSEIWDLRTLKLLNTCSSLKDATYVRFNNDKSVMFAGYNNASQDMIHETLSNTFKVIDTSSYQLLASHTFERHEIHDISIDPIYNYVSLLSHNSPFSSVKIYEIGQTKADVPYEDDDEHMESDQDSESDDDEEDDDDDDEVDLFGNHPIFDDGDEDFMSDDENNIIIVEDGDDEEDLDEAEANDDDTEIVYDLDDDEELL